LNPQLDVRLEEFCHVLELGRHENGNAVSVKVEAPQLRQVGQRQMGAIVFNLFLNEAKVLSRDLP
jgi:hypothetical protein